MKAWLAWSSGKDSAWSLHVLRGSPGVEVVALFTTVSAVRDRVAMHEVPRSLLQAQADAAGLPLVVAPLPEPCPNDAYEAAMARAMADARGQGVAAIAFGDLFLEDIRRYREERLAGTGLRLLFPLWGRPTRPLAEEMIAGGLRARLVSVDPRRVPPALAGRDFDRSLLRELPEDVDPCGENGEFHTFAWDGPVFAHPISCRVAGIEERGGFVYADLREATA